jgi:hypothetical protein
MRATIMAGQKEMKAAINSMWSEFEGTSTREWRQSWHLLTNGLGASTELSREYREQKRPS